jgi:hypothetical protein
MHGLAGDREPGLVAQVNRNPIIFRARDLARIINWAEDVQVLGERIDFPKRSVE